MFEQSAHSMELERTYPSGAEEWHCPTCGRRMIMQWPPAYKKIVLEAGDEHATHSGGKGGLHMGAAQVAPADDLLASSQLPCTETSVEDTAPDDGPNHEALGPWLKWLNEGETDCAE
jgi:hypothetical protein